MITANSLEDYRFLPSEISDLDQNIHNLKCELKNNDMSGAQKAEYTAALTELIGFLNTQKGKRSKQLRELQRFMDSIEDPLTRELFRLRYECGKTWNQIYFICMHKGYYYEECSLRMICRRYLVKYNMNEQSQSKRAAAV